MHMYSMHMYSMHMYSMRGVQSCEHETFDGHRSVPICKSHFSQDTRKHMGTKVVGDHRSPSASRSSSVRNHR